MSMHRTRNTRIMFKRWLACLGGDAVLSVPVGPTGSVDCCVAEDAFAEGLRQLCQLPGSRSGVDASNCVAVSS